MMRKESLAWDVSVWDPFFFTNQWNVSQKFWRVNIFCKNNELCSSALSGLGNFVASFLYSPALVSSDELVNTVGKVAWGFKSYV